MLRPQGPENKQQLVVRMGRNLQAAHMGAARIGQPGQHALHVGALQRFARGPEQRRRVAGLPWMLSRRRMSMARAQRRAERQPGRAHQHCQLA
jgi:hypothetical protein